MAEMGARPCRGSRMYEDKASRASSRRYSQIGLCVPSVLSDPRASSKLGSPNDTVV